MEQFLTRSPRTSTPTGPSVRGSRTPGTQGQLRWIPAGQTAASACGDADGTLGDNAAAYGRVTTRCTSRRSSRPTSTPARSTRAPRQLAGVRADGRRLLGRLHRGPRVRPSGPGRAGPFGGSRPAASDGMAFKLQADCYAGTWAKKRLTRRTVSRTATCRRHSTPLRPWGGLRRRTTTAHHGTPAQREGAWGYRLRGGRPIVVQQVPRPGQPRRRGGHAGAGPRCRRSAAAGPWCRRAAAAAAGPWCRLDPRQQDPGYPSDDTGNSYEQYGVAGRG